MCCHPYPMFDVGKLCSWIHLHSPELLRDNGLDGVFPRVIDNVCVGCAPTFRCADTDAYPINMSLEILSDGN